MIYSQTPFLCSPIKSDFTSIYSSSWQKEVGLKKVAFDFLLFIEFSFTCIRYYHPFLLFKNLQQLMQMLPFRILMIHIYK
jgi:hypothetical protein